MLDQKLEKSILKTICYFDMFDYPLTLIEVWRWLFDDRACSLGDIKRCLQNSVMLKEQVGYDKGFYFLVSREEIIGVRRERYNIAIKKFKKVLRLSRYLNFFPYIKLVAISNTLAYNNSDQSGDIDLFVLTENNRLWTARFLVVSFLKLFGLRPTAKNSQDKFCTPFFVSEKYLDLEGVKSMATDDHFACWLSQLWPILDRRTYIQLMDNNGWVKKILSNSIEVRPVSQKKIKSGRLMAELLAVVFDFLPERLFRFIQLKIMPWQIRQVMNKNNDVVINDRLLKFHLRDRRVYYNEKLNHKLASIL